MVRPGVRVVAGALLLLGAAACTDDRDLSSATTVSGDGVEANATITYVVDGDTVDALIETADGRVEERIRLIGIDTPETKRPDTPVECYGPEASAFIEELLPVGTAVRIERDVVGRDDFGRLLGYVYRADDGLFVNHEIVRLGFATPLSIEPNTTFRDLFVDAAIAAEAADLGLWQACGG